MMNEGISQHTVKTFTNPLTQDLANQQNQSTRAQNRTELPTARAGDAYISNSNTELRRNEELEPRASMTSPDLQHIYSSKEGQKDDHTTVNGKN